MIYALEIDYSILSILYQSFGPSVVFLREGDARALYKSHSIQAQRVARSPS